MTLPEMRAQVQLELEHIPSWPDPQNELRMSYWMARMNSLGKKAEGPTDALGVLQKCIAWTKERYPDVELLYDRDFFEGADSQKGFYICRVLPKSLEDDKKSVQRLGHQVLKLLTVSNNEPALGIGPIAFEQTPFSRFVDQLLNTINGHDATPVGIKIKRGATTRLKLQDFLKKNFPKTMVEDVTVDGESIYA